MRGYDIADVDGDTNDEIVWASADNKTKWCECCEHTKFHRIS